MEIIAHRGFWKNPCEKNSKISFSRALKNNFGIEIDIRDYCGLLVISHDIPVSHSQTFENFLKCYVQESVTKSKPPILAINIKSDGLRAMLEELLHKYKITNYFVFDMSIPDAVSYLNSNMNVFMRKSEYENLSEALGSVNGVWLDQFLSNWYSLEYIDTLFNRWDKVCIVSPELHGRDYRNCWKLLKKIPLKNRDNLMLCTDHPKQAKEYFL